MSTSTSTNDQATGIDSTATAATANSTTVPSTAAAGSASSTQSNTNEVESLDDFIMRHTRDLALISDPDFRGHCEGCQEPVIGASGVSYKTDGLQRYFHQACFKCSKCQTALKDGVEFFINVGKPHCHKCYREQVLGFCYACAELLDETGLIKTNGRQFHPKCFVCKQCTKALEGSFFEKDNAYWCKECYREKFIPKCGKCGQKILPDENADHIMTVEWKGQKFHQDCFACADCSKPFTNLKALQLDGNLYCRDCHAIRHKTRASVTERPQ